MTYRVFIEPSGGKTKEISHIILSEMFAFSESHKIQEIKLISPSTNISLVKSKPIFDNVHCIYYIQLIPTVIIKLICELYYH